jgi:hypothetical protein
MRLSLKILLTPATCSHDKWVPVTMARRVVWLQLEEYIEKKSRTAKKGWFYGLEVGRGTTNPLTVKKNSLVTKQKNEVGRLIGAILLCLAVRF